jgi:hypothetical protein
VRSANGVLLKALDRELMFVKRDLQKLPKVSSFECSTDNAVATLRRTIGNEEITVTMDTNSGVDMDLLGEEESEMEGGTEGSEVSYGTSTVSSTNNYNTFVNAPLV